MSLPGMALHTHRPLLVLSGGVAGELLPPTSFIPVVSVAAFVYMSDAILI